MYNDSELLEDDEILVISDDVGDVEVNPNKNIWPRSGV